MNVQYTGAAPGIWTADVVAARAKAARESAACIVVACKPLDQCGNCRRVAAVLESAEFMAVAQQRGWYLVYLVKGVDPLWPSYIAGPALRLPIISRYAPLDGCLAKRVAYSAEMTTPSGLIRLIDSMLAGRVPAPVKSWWMFWKR